MNSRLRHRQRGVGTALGLMLVSPAAHAHAVIAGINDFYAGFLHPLTAVEHLLPITALGLLIAQQGLAVNQKEQLTKAQGTFSTFLLALITGAVLALWLPHHWPMVAMLNLGSVVIFGGLAAMDRLAPRAILYGLATLFGLSHGYANGSAITPAVSPYLFISGLWLATTLLLAYSTAAAHFALSRQAHWPRIAVRVVGSWIAAIGILLLGMGGKTINAL